MRAFEAKNLSYQYPDGKMALENINISVEENEVLGIVGPAGAGKTTLLLSINGTIASNGDILVFGNKVEKKNYEMIRKTVGFVFQNPDDQLFSSTIYEDVAFGPANYGVRKDGLKLLVAQALKKVSLEGFEQRSPHHLSAGEKKKASIATVLSMNCELLVLDEPTSNMDPISRKHLLEVLKTIKKTMILAGHDIPFFSSICDKIAVMDEGKIVAFGKTTEIFSSTELAKKYGFECSPCPFGK